MAQVQEQMLTKKQMHRKLDSAFHDATDGLSSATLAKLIKNQDAVFSALIAFLEALSKTHADANIEQQPEVEFIKGEKLRKYSAAKAKKEIARQTIPIEEENLLTSDELAVRVGLKTRQSVHDWLRKGKIVGWRGAKRGYVFPEGQLDERGRPPEGLEKVVSYFDDGYTVWFWLTTPRNSLDGMEPLALLRKGEIDRVLDAAIGDRQGDFA
ncbi:MAG: hypothetical protein OXG03_03070 [Gammaproteobacteria bacterium]|nr:hypothetical protein [Gammaproteobacteria bacterium]